MDKPLSAEAQEQSWNLPSEPFSSFHSIDVTNSKEFQSDLVTSVALNFCYGSLDKEETYKKPTRTLRPASNIQSVISKVAEAGILTKTQIRRIHSTGSENLIISI